MPAVENSEEQQEISVENNETNDTTQEETTESTIVSSKIKDDLLNEIRFSLLKCLFKKLDVVENVGGKQAIPYFQVRLFFLIS